jgi:hypothetical protein
MIVGAAPYERALRKHGIEVNEALSASPGPYWSQILPSSENWPNAASVGQYRLMRPSA